MQVSNNVKPVFSGLTDASITSFRVQGTQVGNSTEYPILSSLRKPCLNPL